MTLADVGQATQPDSSDAYGIDLRIGPLGDLVVAQTGDLVRAWGPENVAQALTSRIKTYPGELPLHDDYGSALLARVVGSKSSNEDALRSAARIEVQNILEADRRFLAARNLTVALDPEDANTVLVGLALELAGGEQLLISDLAQARVDEIDRDANLIDLDLAQTIDTFDDEDVDLDDFDDELETAILDQDNSSQPFDG